MKKTMKKFNIDNKFYLFAPITLVAFILFDVIGGFNTPGYTWTSKVIADLTALDSYSFVLSLVFSIIFALIAVVAAYCVWRFFKNTNFNKNLKKSISVGCFALVIFALGTTIFLQPETGTYPKFIEKAVISTTQTDVQDGAGNVTETTETFDMDGTIENFKGAFEEINNPLMLGNFICGVASGILAFIAMIFGVIGGFKKGGNIIFAALSIFFGIMLIYTAISFFFGELDLLGLNTRFGTYSIVAFVAFAGSFIYVTNIKE